MVSITLAIPEELKKEMNKHPEINWSEIARQAIKQRIHLLNEMDKLLSKSELTEKDTIILGKKINREAARKLKEMV